MDFRQFRYFVTTAEELHMARAAERLGIAQPALSQQIKSLETQLGTRLFLRTKRRIELTDAGLALFQEARNVLEHAERAVRLARDIGRGEAGHIDIGIVGSAMFDRPFPLLLTAFRKTRQTPVLMLTARVSVEDRVLGLQTGADDYLVKPFAFSELSARIQVLLRRTQGARVAAEPTQLRLADLDVDLVRRKASRGGQRLELTAKEFLLLTLFLRRKGEVLSRTEIAEQVWDMNFDSDTNVVEVAIRRLRTKIDVPFDTALLHTIRGMGYVMEERNG